MKKVVIQPRFVLHNDTPLPLLFEPRAKATSKISNAKTFFSLPGSTKKQSVTCCGSSQLEMIHSKLNALNGATITPSSPSARSTVFKGAQGGVSSAGSAARTQEEMEYFYCSESNVLNIQIEGNAVQGSSAQQFRLDAAMGGANSSLRLFDEGKKQWYDLVAILEQLDSYTTKVTFVERYLVLNRTTHKFICMPACDIIPHSGHQDQKSKSASAADSAMVVKPSATTSFSWCVRPTIPSDACIRLKIQGGGGDGNITGWRWSGKMSLHEVSETALKLSNKYTNQVHVLRVEVRVEASVRVYVVLTSEDTALFPLYRIINSSASEIIHFKQCFDGGHGDLSEQSPVSLEYNRGVTQRLFPGESICFGWDEAYFMQSLERVLSVTYSADAAHTKILLDQPGTAQRVEIPATKTKAASEIFLHWYLNGVTKTVHVHDTELPRDKLTGKQNAPPPSDRVESSNSVLQRASTLVSELNLNLKLPNVILSVLNSKPEEVLLFSAQDVECAYAKTMGEHDQCEIKIGSFQLDNQLENAVFPVIFTPIPSNKSAISFIESAQKAARPMTPPTIQERKKSNADTVSGEDDEEEERFLHMSIFRLSYGDDVEYIKYFSALLQPARLQIDDFLVISLGSVFSDCMQVVLRYYPPSSTRPPSNSEVDCSAANAAPPLKRGSSAVAGARDEGMASLNSTADVTIEKIPPVERRMYIETLHLHPMKMQLTFQQNSLSKATLFDDQATMLLPVVYMILKSNLVNIDCAALNLNALHIYHSFTTRAFMLSTIQQHYAFQGVLQIYALVGAADILGNPIGLVTNLGTGVKDFFYEPVAGMVQSPQEFVLGLSRGTASLVKNSVYGTFNAASKFTGTLSSGIAALSMDSKYIKERNTRNRQEVPTHLGTGLLYGTKQLGQGILAGVSGVITAPAIGAYNNGLTGFVEGVGKGLIGVAVKPTAGILDLAARTTAGITATATVFDKKARNTRMRLPRMMHTSDKRLRVYSSDEALISQLLHKLPQRLSQNEHYEAHVFLPLSRVVVATSHQFLHVDYSLIAAAAAMGGASPPRITWKCSLTSLWGAQKTAKGVHIMIGTATNVQVSPSVNTLMTKSSMSTVLIPLRDTESAFADRVVKCVATVVAQQRERTPIAETYSAPPPRNSIGLVLEPIRDQEHVQGYEGYGGRVVDVFLGSACFRAGVEVGDIIVGFGGKKLEAGDHGSALRYQLSLMKKGDTLELMVLRHGEIKTIRVATE
uniref:PDZ domain-containing protein n=1 Tax=Globisporangium ultimum (strain ATCC 200006 / CBS 805.95 / DAOM BR144) TaxID=431595 RepID=K3W5D9_GLOUD